MKKIGRPAKTSSWLQRLSNTGPGPIRRLRSQVIAGNPSIKADIIYTQPWQWQKNVNFGSHFKYETFLGEAGSRAQKWLKTKTKLLCHVEFIQIGISNAGVKGLLCVNLYQWK